MKYTTLYEMQTESEFTPSKFFDTAREKYLTDLLDEAEDYQQHLKGLIFVMTCAVAALSLLLVIFAMVIIEGNI